MASGFTMIGDDELERIREILSRADIIYGLENINPMLQDLLDNMALDIDWLIDRLETAWSMVYAYQEELRYYYEQDR